MKKVINKKQIKEDMYDDMMSDEDTLDDYYSGPDVDAIKARMQKSFMKRGISATKSEILVETLMSLVDPIILNGFDTKSMSVLNKAVEFINNRL